MVKKIDTVGRGSRAAAEKQHGGTFAPPPYTEAAEQISNFWRIWQSHTLLRTQATLCARLR